ncbi:hypothetical protein [Flammeovirga agarivorans]|uniref:Uncharacterized protein n=1 Tax=Flammeovirga agarivorans TaxID=2726742 RepID=A0A7X8SK77_9BACT|nr:hypothetical protein [Flammeovirga agarivorans]NLR91731.1 hypothetical protein [Flammeovirga agarivorans]
MKNYEEQLLSISAEELPKPMSILPYQELITLTSIQSSKDYEIELIKLSEKLPFKISKLPTFGGYSEDWFNVEVNGFKHQLQYCERGSLDILKDCHNQLELFFEILNAVIPSFTSSAIEIANTLDVIKDQRLLIWLRMSSKIYFMYQVNHFFGKSMLTQNVTWMCQELVRMGIFETEKQAFNSKEHIIKGICLCGTPNDMAESLYHELKYS